jgi:hypothetical protein
MFVVFIEQVGHSCCLQIIGCWPDFSPTLYALSQVMFRRVSGPFSSVGWCSDEFQACTQSDVQTSFRPILLSRVMFRRVSDVYSVGWCSDEFQACTQSGDVQTSFRRVLSLMLRRVSGVYSVWCSDEFQAHSLQSGDVQTSFRRVLSRVMFRRVSGVYSVGWCSDEFKAYVSRRLTTNDLSRRNNFNRLIDLSVLLIDNFTFCFT